MVCSHHSQPLQHNHAIAAFCVSMNSSMELPSFHNASLPDPARDFHFATWVSANGHDSNKLPSLGSLRFSLCIPRLVLPDGPVGPQRVWRKSNCLSAGLDGFLGTRFCMSFGSKTFVASQFLERSAVIYGSEPDAYFRPGSIHVCQASGKDSTGQSMPDDDDIENVQDTSSSQSGGSESPDSDIQTSNAQQNCETDWRSFRARLVAEEQAVNSGPRTVGISRKSWAHPLLVPESGCVLVATERLDGLPIFERTVILLLRMGSNRPSEGPFGVILNRPLSKSINDLKLTSKTLTNAFGHCPLHFGGPLQACMFLLLKGGVGGNYFEQVIPGIHYGSEDGLQQAADLVKGKALLPHDFRFYMGYTGWGLDQLKNEIALGLWCVAACSSDLIVSPSSGHLWADILQLMGGQYADLSKRPKNEEY